MTSSDNTRYDSLVKDGLAHVCCGGKDGKPIHERHYYDRMMTCPICYPSVNHYKILNKPKIIKAAHAIKNNGILNKMTSGFIINPTHQKTPIERPKPKGNWKENIGWGIMILIILYMLINLNAIISYFG
jgi:hypothetical protein